jgi:nucleoside-diphosphate-sugar epimerase
MIAKSLAGKCGDVGNVVFLAAGVSNSLCRDQSEYDRERKLLCQTIKDCSKSGDKLVYFSSAGAVYGGNDDFKKEDSPLHPSTVYGRNKKLNESLIQNSGTDYLILRLPNLVGPSQNRHQLVPSLSLQALSGQAVLYEHAERDLLDVEDAVNIICRLLKCVENKELINIATGVSVSVSEIFAKIQKVLGTDAKIKIVPLGDKQRFCVAKLNRYLKKTNMFDKDYYSRVIEKYISGFSADIKFV